MAKKPKTYEVLVRGLGNFSLVNLEVNVLRKGKNVFKKTKEGTASGWPVPYLSFIEENKSPFTLKTTNTQKNWNGKLEYSTDKKIWNEWNGEEISSSDNGELFLRGENNSHIVDTAKKVSEQPFVFSDNNRIQCIGNIETLLDCKMVMNGEHPRMDDSCFNALFYKAKSLTSVYELELPAKQLTCACYNVMFGNTSITKAPKELPAISLAESCYRSMFYGCADLIEAPKTLPAKQTFKGSYASMFSRCSALVNAPEILATSMGEDCCNAMFNKCDSLITPPSKLPATNLGKGCYAGMFIGSYKLNGTIHCPTSTANNPNRLDINVDIPANTATVVYDL